MKLDSDVLGVIAEAEADGSALRLTGHLDRALYAKVARALEAAGGKWNRKAQAHLFGADAAGVVAGLLGTGTVTAEKTVQQYFPTPTEVVGRLVELAGLSPDHVVLEPSAGRGAIAQRVAPLVAAVDCVELYEQHAALIRDGGYARSLTVGDFLAVPPAPVYDRVVMNPPFAGKADVAHVRHALRFVRPGGRLVSVMSSGVTFRTDRGTAGFRGLVDDAGGVIKDLPARAFAESGTDVSSVVAVIPVLADALDGEPPEGREAA